MGRYNKPLKKSILIGMILFLTALCLVLTIGQYFNFRDMLYSQYQEYIRNVLTYTAANIDTDDLAACIRSGEESEKYHELQSFLDDVRRSVELHFLYVIIPLNTEETDNIQNVIAAVSDEEYEFMADELVSLNMLTGDSYSPETAAKYLSAYQSGKLSFFEEISEWGDDYTGLLPLFDSEGNPVAALCMDVPVETIHLQLRTHTIETIVIIVLLGVLFSSVFVIWSDNNITRPLRELERSVVQLAVRSHGQRNPDALVLHAPPIHTDNEIESLAHAIEKMSEDMRDYVNSILETERELARMSVIAHKDALTHVKNKAAYELYSEELQTRIEQQPFHFALLMADVNRLKQMNDAFGHERGDLYLKNCCSILCEVFDHSPVFRIGGDEFLVVLTEQDYENRRVLLETAKLRYCALQSLPFAEPWEKASVSLGLAEFRRGVDHSVKEVFARADQLMYQEKSQAEHDKR